MAPVATTHKRAPPPLPQSALDLNGMVSTDVTTNVDIAKGSTGSFVDGVTLSRDSTTAAAEPPLPPPPAAAEEEVKEKKPKKERRRVSIGGPDGASEVKDIIPMNMEVCSSNTAAAASTQHLSTPSLSLLPSHTRTHTSPHPSNLSLKRNALSSPLYRSTV